MPTLQLKNDSTEYQIRGNAEQAILLIHGLAFDQTGWGPFGELLSEHF
jgi:hypothetical protein